MLLGHSFAPSWSWFVQALTQLSVTQRYYTIQSSQSWNCCISQLFEPDCFVCTGWDVCQSRHLCAPHSPSDESRWRQAVCGAGGCYNAKAVKSSTYCCHHIGWMLDSKRSYCLDVFQGGYNLVSLHQSVCQTVHTLLGDPAPPPANLDGPCGRLFKTRSACWVYECVL